ncbi:adenosylhomocysteinase-like [Chenopodium quinoa]|uniref:adenosylhomocysteinase-like n=1 Tax=Chenopodium quinoa TaxID=63459 RepID=UPI000B783693|nr:adenosylhomocysteinase-like [Chenopodium quinoa]
MAATSLSVEKTTTGRLEIELSEVEMPRLMSCRTEFGPSQPFKGAKMTGSLHMTIQTTVLIETHMALVVEVRWRSCYFFSTQILNGVFLFEDDVWIEIAKYLDGRSLVMLATTCKWFYNTLLAKCVWKYANLRDLAVSGQGNVSFSWKKLYG